MPADNQAEQPPRIEPFDFVEPCEPDCDDVRHARHQGQWEMAQRIKEHYGLEPYPGSDAPTPPAAPAGGLDELLASKNWLYDCTAYGEGQECCVSPTHPNYKRLMQTLAGRIEGLPVFGHVSKETGLRTDYVSRGDVLKLLREGGR